MMKKEITLMTENEKIEMIRSEIPATDNSIYFNTGNAGPPTKRIINTLLEWQTKQMYFGPATPYMISKVSDEIEEAREKLAKFFHVEGQEIILTRDATEGINMIANGLQFKNGDEVVITDLEHPSAILPWYIQNNNRGLRVKIIKLRDLCISNHNLKNQILERLDNEINSNTRIVSLCHISYLNGWILPIKEIASLARKRGAFFFVDGAHSAGQLPLNINNIDCDFYVAAGHKWLLGSMGTGFLYVQKDYIDKLKPLFVGCDAITTYDFEGNYQLVSGPKKFEYGDHARDYIPLIGLGKAIDFLQEVDVVWGYQRICNLAAYLKTRLREVPNITIYTPNNDENPTGLVTFEIQGISSSDLVVYLFNKWRIITRMTAKGVRISTHFFNTEQEIDILIQALKGVVNDGTNT
jgi:selenocysteine lyase/cysteine desulfurase